MKAYKKITPGQAIDALLAGDPNVRVTYGDRWQVPTLNANNDLCVGVNKIYDPLHAEWAIERNTREVTLVAECVNNDITGRATVRIYDAPPWIEGNKLEVTIRKVVS